MRVTQGHRHPDGKYCEDEVLTTEESETAAVTIIEGHHADAFKIPVDVHYHRVEHDGEYSKAYDNPNDIVDTVGCRIVKHITIEFPLNVVSEEPNNG